MSRNSSSSMCEQQTFDIFVSYNWDSKNVVKSLYRKLNCEMAYRVWIDDNQLQNSMLFEQLAEGIKNSRVFICCVTKKYTESANCVREINFAVETRKPIVVIMLEKLVMTEIGSVGFIITPLTRFNWYKERRIFSQWGGDMFESIVSSINSHIDSESLNARTLRLNQQKNNRDPTLETPSPSVKILDANVSKNPAVKEKSSTKESLNIIKKASSKDMLNESDSANSSTAFALAKSRLGNFFSNLKQSPSSNKLTDMEKKESVSKVVVTAPTLTISAEPTGKQQPKAKAEKALKNETVVTTIADMKSCYNGPIVNGKRNGNGVYIYSNGDWYEGDWCDDKQTGRGTYSWTSVGDRYEGDFLDDLKHGIGTFTWANRNRYEGEWQRDERTGYGVFYYADGNRYEGFFKCGKKSGNGTLIYQNGNKYSGQWADDRKEGRGNFTWNELSVNNGNRYEGEFFQDMQHGTGTYYWRNGDMFTGTWLRNLMCGKGVMSYANGDCYEGKMENSQKHGQGTFTWANGIKYVGDFFMDERTGFGHMVWFNGDEYKGNFVAGKRHGKGTFKNESGASQYKGDWLNDERHGIGKQIYKDGNKYEGEWKDNKKSGLGTFLFKSAGDKYVGEFSDDLKNGKGTYYFKDGKKLEGVWFNDTKVNFS